VQGHTRSFLSVIATETEIGLLKSRHETDGTFGIEWALEDVERSIMIRRDWRCGNRGYRKAGAQGGCQFLGVLEVYVAYCVQEPELFKVPFVPNECGVTNGDYGQPQAKCEADFEEKIEV
jgi:hypothetical protein